jgi:group I intron endonuclease
MPQSGIYVIINQVNGKFYIGSSQCLDSRRSKHFNELKKGCHGNQRLQRAYLKYGEQSFCFEVLEYCDVQQLISSEQRYLNIFCGYDFCYNILPVAGCPGHWNHTPEMKAKISKRQSGSGNSMHGKKQTQRYYDSKARTLPSITGPDGKIYSDEKNLKQFCETHGLTRSLMQAVLRGENYQHKGFHLTGTNVDKDFIESNRRKKISQTMRSPGINPQI